VTETRVPLCYLGVRLLCAQRTCRFHRRIPMRCGRRGSTGRVRAAVRRPSRIARTAQGPGLPSRRSSDPSANEARPSSSADRRNELVKLPCGSVSMAKSRLPRSCDTDASSQTACVLPTPPLRFSTVITLAEFPAGTVIVQERSIARAGCAKRGRCMFHGQIVRLGIVFLGWIDWGGDLRSAVSAGSETRAEQRRRLAPNSRITSTCNRRWVFQRAAVVKPYLVSSRPLA